MIRSEKAAVNMLLYAFVYFIARNDLKCALLPPEDRQGLMVAFPGSPGAGRPHASSWGIRAPCLCWLHIRHCHMSLKQFFCCCLHSPPSSLLCAYSVSSSARHTPTQLADSSLVVLLLSAFFIVSALQETAKLYSSNISKVPRPYRCSHG